MVVHISLFFPDIRFLVSGAICNESLHLLVLVIGISGNLPSQVIGDNCNKYCISFVRVHLRSFIRKSDTTQEEQITTNI